MRFRLMVERDFAVMATRRQGGKESIAKSEANAPLACAHRDDRVYFIAASYPSAT
jgi:hypothetical protein